MILVNGTFENGYANWSIAGRVHGIGDMRDSARELARVVDRVRAATRVRSR